MAVNWLSALVMTGLLLISVFAAALAGYRAFAKALAVRQPELLLG